MIDHLFQTFEKGDALGNFVLVSMGNISGNHEETITNMPGDGREILFEIES